MDPLPQARDQRLHPGRGARAALARIEGRGGDEAADTSTGHRGAGAGRGVASAAAMADSSARSAVVTRGDATAVPNNADATAADATIAAAATAAAGAALCGRRSVLAAAAAR